MSTTTASQDIGQVERSVVPSALALPVEEAIEAAIRTTPDPGLIHARLKQIAFSWPNLPGTVNRFCATISHLFPDVGAGGYLLSNALVAATSAFVSAATETGSKARKPVGDYAATSAFMAALLDSARAIASVDVYGVVQGKSKRWLLGSEDLVSFAQKFDALLFEETVPREREVVGVRMVLLGQILTVEDAAMLDICPRSASCVAAGTAPLTASTAAMAHRPV